MSRRLTLQTKELGKLELYLIYEYAGILEEPWRGLHGHETIKLFTRVPHDVIEHAILGWSSPLVKALGLLPEGCLRKLPTRECEHAKACSLHVKADCLTTAKKMPWCFEPSGFELPIRRLLAEVIKLWRERVYVMIVEEPANAR